VRRAACGHAATVAERRRRPARGRYGAAGGAGGKGPGRSPLSIAAAIATIARCMRWRVTVRLRSRVIMLGGSWLPSTRTISSSIGPMLSMTIDPGPDGAGCARIEDDALVPAVPVPTRARFAAQLLAGERARDPVAVAQRLLAVQAQDLVSARLALHARTEGGSAADLDRALTQARTLVIGWLARGTLHLVRREDHWWLHALTTPPLHTATARRLRQTGVEEGAQRRGLRVIESSLAGEGPQTRAQLRERLARARVPTAGRALVHLLIAASLRGIAVRGPMAGREHAYVLARDWLGPAPALERDAALAELARRWLAGHGPGGERDLARWAGLPLRDARTGLRAIAGELDERPDGLLALRGPRPAPRRGRSCSTAGIRCSSAVRERGWLFAERPPSLEDFLPYAYAGGRAVATWTRRGAAVTIGTPFIALGSGRRRALERAAREAGRYLAGDAGR